MPIRNSRVVYWLQLQMNRNLADKKPDIHLQAHLQTIESEVDSEGHINIFEWSWQIFSRGVDLVFKRDGMRTVNKTNLGEIMEGMSQMIKNITTCGGMLS